jgi:hypothetical protein
MPSILLTNQQAKQCPFPPTSSVYILDQGHFIPRGEVKSVLMNLNPPEILYKVKSAASTVYITQDKLRFQVGCRVKVQYRSNKNVSHRNKRMESLEGMILGTCEIPVDDDRYDNANPHKNFWYSVQVMGTNDGVPFAKRILLVYPADVSLCSIPVEDTSIEKGPIMPIGKFPRKKIVTKSKVFNINITSKKNKTSCQLKVGHYKKLERNKSTTKKKKNMKIVTKRKLDVFEKGDAPEATRDDSSVCTMVTETDFKDDLPVAMGDDSSVYTMVPDIVLNNEEDNENFMEHCLHQMGSYEISI